MRISDWSSDVCSSDLALVRAIVDPVDREVAGLNIPRRNVEPGERGGDLVHGFRVAGAGGLRVGGDARQAGSEQRLIGGGFGAPRAGDGQHGFVAIDTARVGRSGGAGGEAEQGREERSEEHTSELQSLMRISYAVFCLKKKNSDLTPHNQLRLLTQHLLENTPQYTKLRNHHLSSTQQQ